jgi:hypothetical protein
LISDGARNFHTAYKKKIQTHTHSRTKQISHTRVHGDTNNNKMDRVQGEIRDREKFMWGLKRPDTPILKGLRIYHNYIPEDEAIKEQTAARQAGIKVERKNKWKMLIENASSESKTV